MERQVSTPNVLVEFIKDFIKVADGLGVKYALVSGIVAILHGRSRGTEDVDLIVERLDRDAFARLHERLDSAGFECIQGNHAGDLYRNYLAENLGIRYVRKGSFVPDMELKLSKDALDEKQLRERTRLPLTGVPFYFSTIETNIAFKEELLKSPKDLEDARHLRAVYADRIEEKKVAELKRLIREYRLR